MTLRSKIVLYLVLMHLLLGAVALLALHDRRPWLIAAEALFAISIVIGVALVRELFVPLNLIRTGTELIEERDFTTRFREVGQPEMDHLIGIYNRMADRLREERLKLAEQYELMDKILHASPSGILILDFDGRVQLINPAAEQLLRLAAESTLGRRLEELEGPLAAPLSHLPVDRAEVLAIQGGRRLRCRRVGFVDRGFRRSFVLVEELTEELRASEKAAYGKLIRMMSHEVNNSVGAVRSLLDSCRTYRDQLGAEDRDDFAGALDVAVKRLEHLNAFMNGFADVVRLPDPRPGPCDLRRLTEEVLALMRPELRRRAIEDRLDAADALPAIRADSHQLEQVLVNVLKNAAESIEEHGRIDVRLGVDEERPFLSVRDSGRGIDAQARERLFTPFFSTKRDGRGIGLTLVQEILTRHGFDFALRGCDDGGAEFRIDF